MLTDLIALWFSEILQDKFQSDFCPGPSLPYALHLVRVAQR